MNILCSTAETTKIYDILFASGLDPYLNQGYCRINPSKPDLSIPLQSLP